MEPEPSRFLRRKKPSERRPWCGLGGARRRRPLPNKQSPEPIRGERRSPRSPSRREDLQSGPPVAFYQLSFTPRPAPSVPVPRPEACGRPLRRGRSRAGAGAAAEVRTRGGGGEVRASRAVRRDQTGPGLPPAPPGRPSAPPKAKPAGGRGNPGGAARPRRRPAAGTPGVAGTPRTLKTLKPRTTRRRLARGRGVRPQGVPGRRAGRTQTTAPIVVGGTAPGGPGPPRFSSALVRLGPTGLDLHRERAAAG